MDGKCLKWHKYCQPNGYGQMRYQGKIRLAHRVMYCEAYGLDIDSIDGHIVMHLCDNPSCVNIHHLKLGTTQDQVDYKVSRNRQSRREHHGRAKLTVAYAHAIRLDTRSDSVIANERGVSRAAVYFVKRRKTWQPV